MTKKILMVIAPDQFRDEEFFEPHALFTQQYHWHVTVASTRTGEAQGMLGKTFMVTETLDTQKEDSFDALVIAGGMGSPEFLWKNETLLSLVKQFHHNQKPVGAICLSGAVFAIAGILTGKKATVWPADEALALFEKHGALYTEQPVVVDGNIITSPGPEAAKVFGEAIAKQIQAASTVPSA